MVQNAALPVTTKSKVVGMVLRLIDRASFCLCSGAYISHLFGYWQTIPDYAHMPYRPSPLPIAQTITTTVSCSFFIADPDSRLVDCRQL